MCRNSRGRGVVAFNVERKLSRSEMSQDIKCISLDDPALYVFFVSYPLKNENFAIMNENT